MGLKIEQFRPEGPKIFFSLGLRSKYLYYFTNFQARNKGPTFKSLKLDFEF
jgi:hypothetical protein